MKVAEISSLELSYRANGAISCPSEAAQFPLHGISAVYPPFKISQIKNIHIL